jgi:hypothetical protein
MLSLFKGERTPMADPTCFFCGLPGTKDYPLTDPDVHWAPDPEHGGRDVCIALLQGRIKELEARAARVEKLAGRWEKAPTVVDPAITAELRYTLKGEAA